ncbi:MAG: S41 family peptidase [bacterium]|nr:S41 family peptidase [bacterium]
MQKERSKNIGTVVGVVILIAVSFGVGVNVGNNQVSSVATSNILNVDNGKPDEVDFSPFWKAWNILNEKYVTTATSTSDQQKIWGAIEGLAASLGDPYTSFFPPVEKKQFDEEISGNFEGVGMEVDLRDGVLTVVAPLKGTPAYRAGIEPEDQIIKIDDKPTLGLSVEDAVKAIRGPKGSTVTLTIFRLKNGEEPIKVEIVRDVIDIPSLETETKDGVFIIRLYNFSAPSQNDFREALREFVEAQTPYLVLDLRGNPGGYLGSSIDMASWFLPQGKVIVTEDFGQNSEPRVYRSLGRNAFNKNLRMVILVNGGTASASEILAGALSEHKMAVLVGTQTFGKGSVQELVPVTEDTALKVTIARWLTPNGLSLSEGGITPDVVVEMTREDIEAGLDPQLDKALELVKNM